MPIRPSVAENIRYLQRQINQQGTGRFGPMSVGPGEGHLRFYAADGRVLFEADSGGARVESRGSLTGLTPLLDSIRDKDDAQDGTLGQYGGRLDGHDTTLASHNTRISTAQSRADSAYALAEGRATTASVSAAHNRANAAFTLADNAFDLAAGRATVGSVTEAHARANAAYTRAGTGISNAATAQSRADNAHTRIDGLNYASPGDIATLSNQVQALRSQVHDWMQTARASNPSLPPPIPN